MLLDLHNQLRGRLKVMRLSVLRHFLPQLLSRVRIELRRLHQLGQPLVLGPAAPPFVGPDHAAMEQMMAYLTAMLSE